MILIHTSKEVRINKMNNTNNTNNRNIDISNNIDNAIKEEEHTVIINKKNKNAYDALSKMILSDKTILANIMKGCIPEYRDYSIKEIKTYIEDDNNADHIRGLKNEAISINKGKIEYDILFSSRLPNSDDLISMYINIEPQNNNHPSYPLINRALYYAAKILADQKGIDFNNSEYNKIKKVYSIWINLNPDKKDYNTINLYSINENNIRGNSHILHDYKLINVIMLNVGRDYRFEDNDPDILKLLYLLFINSALNTYQVSKILKDDYDIIKTDKEVEGMRGFSESFYNAGVEQEHKEANNRTAEMLINMMEEFNLSSEQLLSSKNISDEVVTLFKEKLKNKVE